MSLEKSLLKEIQEIKNQNKSTNPKKVTEFDKVKVSDISPLSDKSLVKSIEDKDKDEWITLRTKYANKIYYLLCAEIALLFILLILLGTNLIKLEDSTINITIMAVITQSFFLVKEIVTNLFKQK